MALVAAVYLAIDFQRTRSDFVARYQRQASSLASWTERRLDHVAGLMGEVASGSPDLCNAETMNRLRHRAGSLAIAEIQVQGREGVSCASRSGGGSRAEAACGHPPDRNMLRIPVKLDDGWMILLDLDGDCLLDTAAPMEAGAEIRRSILAPRYDGGALTVQSAPRPGGTLSIMSKLFPPMEMTAGSNKWPVTVVIQAKQTSIARHWLATVPFQLSLISALGLALWFGPMTLVRRHLSVEGQVRTALRRGNFFLVYLPTVDISTRSWVGAEALLRWRHARHGVLMPNAFIPWIEASPLIHETTRFVMIQAARDLTEMTRHAPDFSLAVNVPPSQLSDRRLIEIADLAFGRHPLALCQVIFELTERQMLDYDAPGLSDVLQGLRSRGAQIAVDDFGVGFSNLALLGMIDVDFVKIDRSFLQDQTWAEPRMLEAMVPLLRERGMIIIAEGVETEEQLERIRRCGIRFAQGFLFSRPIELGTLLDGLRPRVADRADRAQPIQPEVR